MKSVKWVQLQVTEVGEKSATEHPSPLRERVVSLKKRHWSYLLAITRSLEVEGEDENTASTKFKTQGLEVSSWIYSRIGWSKFERGMRPLLT